MPEPIYLDYNATTPIDPRVAEAMGPALREAWGNPSSAHAYGRAARSLVDRARAEVAALIGSDPTEIVFTSGGTESDNAAVIGVAEALEDRGRHVVTTAVEHAAVGKAVDALERRGWEVTRVGVDAQCRVDADAVAAAVRDDTVLVTVIHAQNETAVLQPVRAIADHVRPRGVVLHADTAQTVGKMPVAVDELGVDLLSVAAHKFYGPKGAGALFVRRGTPFRAYLHGAGHEGGRRAGTENVPGVAGLGEACRIAREALPGRTEHMLRIRDRLEAGLRERFPDLVVHGGEVERLASTLSCAIPGCDAVELLARAEGIAAAGGAACHAGQRHVSGVLRAMGVPDEIAYGTMRLCVGSPTTEEDADRAAAILAEAAAAVRA